MSDYLTVVRDAAARMDAAPVQPIRRQNEEQKRKAAAQRMRRSREKALLHAAQ